MHKHVKQNDRIKGKISNRMRQVDITIRQGIGQYDLLIAIDCKAYKKPVDIKKIEEFIGLIKDINANKGAIISASGFTKSAKVRAEEAGIDIFRLIDTESPNWKTFVSIPVVCDIRKIKSFRYILKSEKEIIEIVKHAFDPRIMMIFNEQGESIDSPNNILAKRWNLGQLPKEPGEHFNINLIKAPVFIKVKGILYPVKIEVNVTVIKELYFGQLPLPEIRGFEDQIKGGIISSGFTTGTLNFADVEKNWKRIKSEEELVTLPVIHFLAIDNYPLVKFNNAS